MSWRKIVIAILLSPILAGLLVFVGLLFIWKLPMFCCERLRAVGYLPYAGLAYYGLAVPLLLTAAGFAWWEIPVGVGLLALGGDWLLPDPFSYVLNPRKRRAVRVAIGFVEDGEGFRVNYGTVRVVGSEVGRMIVAVAIEGHIGRRFLAVADDTASVDQVDFEYVSTKHGVHARGWGWIVHDPVTADYSSDSVNPK